MWHPESRRIYQLGSRQEFLLIELLWGRRKENLKLTTDNL